MIPTIELPEAQPRLAFSELNTKCFVGTHVKLGCSSDLFELGLRVRRKHPNFRTPGILGLRENVVIDTDASRQ